jgi:glycosyltransferase involved in cell wall biosynthesis
MVERPRLCFVGPMLGTNPGWVVSQGEILADLLSRDGYEVRLTSRFPDRVPRLSDTVVSLLRWSRQTDIAVVMVFGGLGFLVADIASWLLRRLRTRMVLALHGGSLPALTERHPAWVRRVLARGDAVVAPSGYLGAAARRLGFAAEIIPNVLDLEGYPYQPRRLVQPSLLWMRTFHQNYDPELAIEVFRNLHRSHPEACLTMAGQDKGSREAVRRMAKGHDLGDRVSFPGFLDEPGKRREFARHDIFLNTNRVDNMPVSLLEAAAFGLPIVATSVGGIPFLFRDEETALLVASGDVEGMAQAIERLLTEPELAETLSRNGRALAERSAWPLVKEAWEALFARLWSRA